MVDADEFGHHRRADIGHLDLPNSKANANRANPCIRGTALALFGAIPASTTNISKPSSAHAVSSAET
jgi:hypothetical protein